MAPTISERRKAIHHVVHEYANFVSSAHMVIKGDHLGKVFESPINVHLAHAFLLNCRKMADFFDSNGNKSSKDDVVAWHYVSTVSFDMLISKQWREPLNKQLAHVTYTRDKKPKEPLKEDQEALRKEITEAWTLFLGHLPEPYKTDFGNEIAAANKKQGFEHLTLR